MDLTLSYGEGRTEVSLETVDMGSDLLIRIFNRNAHIGAVAIGEYDHEHQRASVSVVTRLGHKDDAIARNTAYLVSKATRRTCCVVAGVHLDEITLDEIETITQNADVLIGNLIQKLT